MRHDNPKFFDAVTGGLLPGGGGPADPLDLFDEFEGGGPIPHGTYDAVAVSGKLIQSNSGTLGYRIGYRLTGAGEYHGRHVTGTLWLTERAMSYSKPVLAQFGLDSKQKLKSPFPAGRYLCKVRVALRSHDEGFARNEVSDVRVTGVQEPPQDPSRDPFAPAEEGGEQ